MQSCDIISAMRCLTNLKIVAQLRCHQGTFWNNLHFFKGCHPLVDLLFIELMSHLSSKCTVNQYISHVN